ncbi:MAG TPA: hypothetical protein VLC08_04850 [Chitinolyticbacter sp.]|nr:hypothetical protein [Chitinolyticbacter sp.]
MTIIAWALIIFGAILAVSTLLAMNDPALIEQMRRSPMPIPVQYAITAASLLLMMIAGIAMLKGRNWARQLCVIASIIGLLIGLAISPIKAILLPGMVILFALIFFLFSPRANYFFHVRYGSFERGLLTIMRL